MAMLRSLGSRSVIISPSTRTSPAVGRSRPTIMLSRVDLPHPEGPTRMKNSPSPMLRSVGSTARVPSGKRFSIPSRIDLCHG